MGKVSMNCQESSSFKVVCDDRCAVVRRLEHIVKMWDVHHKFDFVDSHSDNAGHKSLLKELDACRWSLRLIDDLGNRWDGPEAIPIILKTLPFGKIAAVFYILPGTAWLTKQGYLLVSRNRSMFAQRQKTA